MNCWKTINLSKDIGLYKIYFLSLIVMFFSFIAVYLPLNLIFQGIHLREDNFIYLVLFFIVLVPIHKLLHILPLWLRFQKVNIQVKWSNMFIPIFRTKACRAVTKRLLLISLMTPFIVISILFMACIILFPNYFHYFSIALAFHIGCCVPDFVCINQMIRAPRFCMIEEVEDGYDILVRQ
ncbi:DUF3267 domain-containing protein [Bacillus carboniphilus]|uniref:DUF3267 domain-containing protein n=1 Tax=Bacillus carboniphilus TaxID=86663 RepID=A0ABY9JVM1_9BACI|nr:DUF3267 domain-containing protein [Bacillus carboniphilus]WLR42839.1 DUF3267 domain-containing protein [Bacillus carboniphilus]